MMDVAEIQMLEATKLKIDLEEDSVSKYRRLKAAQERHLEDYAKSMEHKANAEKNLPSVLNSIQEDIKRTIRYGNTSTTYHVGKKDIEAAFLATMVISVLSMQGLICYFNDHGNIEIVW